MIEVRLQRPATLALRVRAEVVSQISLT